MHSNFASRFDLLFSFESEKASVNPAALCRNRYKISLLLFYFFAGHLVPFSSLLISGHVSWAWFFSFFSSSFLPVLEWMARPLTLIPNWRPACFSAPFWQPPLFPRDRQSLRVYSMLRCQLLWERCDLHTVLPGAFSFSVLGFFSFGRKKAHCRNISFTW